MNNTVVCASAAIAGCAYFFTTYARAPPMAYAGYFSINILSGGIQNEEAW